MPLLEHLLPPNLLKFVCCLTPLHSIAPATTDIRPQGQGLLSVWFTGVSQMPVLVPVHFQIKTLNR